MGKALEIFKQKYPNYKIIKYTKDYNYFEFLDENNILYYKNNVYRAINFKIGIESAVNKIKYIQNILNSFNNKYIIIKYSGMKGKSIVKLNGFTYIVNTYDLLNGHDVSNINCIDVIKSNVSKSEKCGFSRSKFKSLYKNKLVNLYLINIFYKDENFYKIGVTGKSIKKKI